MLWRSVKKVIRIDLDKGKLFALLLKPELALSPLTMTTAVKRISTNIYEYGGLTVYQLVYPWGEVRYQVYKGRAKRDELIYAVGHNRVEVTYSTKRIFASLDDVMRRVELLLNNVCRRQAQAEDVDELPDEEKERWR